MGGPGQKPSNKQPKFFLFVSFSALKKLIYRGPK